MIRDQAIESEAAADADEQIRSKSRTEWAPTLSVEEECDLAARIKEGDAAARRRLILANLRVVIDIARRYGSRKLPLDDLIQEGNLGLIRASADFDPTVHDCRFYTYASVWIRAFIRKALVVNDSIIRVPHHAFRRQQEHRTGLASSPGEPGPGGAEDIAREPEASPQCDAPAYSVDDADFVPLLDAIVDPRRPEQEAAEQERRLSLELALSRLNPVEAWVLRERYGLSLRIPGAEQWTSPEPSAPRGERRSNRDRAEAEPSTPCRAYFHRSYLEMRRDCGLSHHRILQVEKAALAKLREALSV